MTPKDKLHAEIDRLSDEEADAARVVVRHKQDCDEIGRAIAEGYRRIPQDTPDEWGDITKFGKTIVVVAPSDDEQTD